MKKIWICIAIILVIGIFLSLRKTEIALLPSVARNDDKTVSIVFPNGEIIFADVADDPVEQTQGLSDRFTPQSMLFLFDQKTLPGFWMKDMRFAIDIVWLDNGKVVGFEKNLQPEDSPKTIYRPPTLITAALEVAAGTVDKHALEISDQLDIKFQKQ